MATYGDGTSGGFKVEKLTGDSYYSWKFQMKMALVGKDLWDIVTGDEVLDGTAAVVQQFCSSKFQRRENIALATICLSVLPSLQIYVRAAKSAKEAWNNLEQHFEKRSLSQKIFYRRKLYSARLEKGTTMLEHVNGLQTLSDHLEAVGDPIMEKDLVIILISSLTEDYNHLITALETIAEDRLSWVYVRDRVLHEYEKLHQHAANEGAATKNDDALLVISKKKSDAQPNNGTEQSGDEWLIDSGASQHMTYENSGMLNYEKFSTPRNIRLADNRIVHAYGKGNIRIPIYDGTKKWNFMLCGVFFVPELKRKLLSLSSMIDKGNEICFDGKSCTATNNGLSVAIGHKQGNLFKLNNRKSDSACAVSSQDSNGKMNLWHSRYAHLGINNLKLLKEKSMVDGLVFNSKESIDSCEICAKGKQRCEPFPKKSQSQTTQLLELVHSDVGIVNIDSVGGSRYYVTFIDDFSRYTVVHFLKKKSEVLDKFKKFVAVMENLTEKKVKALRTDNGVLVCIRIEESPDNETEEFSDESFPNTKGNESENLEEAELLLIMLDDHDIEDEDQSSWSNDEKNPAIFVLDA
eukprot:gene16599-biopygen14022